MKLSKTSIWAKLYMLFVGTGELPKHKATLLYYLLAIIVFLPFSLLQLLVNYILVRRANYDYNKGIDCFFIMILNIIWLVYNETNFKPEKYIISFSVVGCIMLLFFLLRYTNVFGDPEITWED